MRIAVCDDDQMILQQMDQYLRTVFEDSGVPLSLFFFSSGEELLESMPENTDVLFLDIQMNGLNGIETARKLRERCRDLILVFITSNVEYALEGYSVHAYSFIPKPVNYHTVRRLIKEILEQKKKSRDPAITLSANGRTDRIFIHEILYIEVFHHDVSIVSDSGKKEYRIPLSVLEKKLEDMNFFRCHKSYLVNLERIESIRSSCVVMENKDEIPLSKYRAKEFMDAFTSFTGDVL